MTVTPLPLLTPVLDQILVFCQAGSNKLFFSRADTGQFIKSYTIAEEVSDAPA